MYNDGVDVIFVAAGQSGTGVIEAATEMSTPSRKLWAIGVDTDQFFDVTDAQRAHLLTSMYKRTDLAAAAVIAAQVRGALKAPSVVTATLADGAVGYTNSGGYLQPSTIEALESFKAKIVDGTIVVDPVPATEPPTDINDTFTFDLRTGTRTPLPEGIAGASHYAVSPDGTKLAMLPCCDAETMKISDVDGSNAITTQAPAGTHFWWPQWSPDGTKVVFQQRDAIYSTDLGALVVDDLVTGQRTQLTDFPSPAFWWWWMPPQFSPDGRSVIFHKPRDSGEHTLWDIWSVPVTGGEPALLLEDAALATYLPTGEIVYVRTADGNVPDALMIADPATGTRRALVARPVTASFMPSVSPDGTRVAYPDGDTIFVVDVATGKTSEVVGGIDVDWLDNDTLIVIDG